MRSSAWLACRLSVMPGCVEKAVGKVFDGFLRILALCDQHEELQAATEQGHDGAIKCVQLGYMDSVPRQHRVPSPTTGKLVRTATEVVEEKCRSDVFFVTGSSDCTAKVWSANGRLRATLPRPRRREQQKDGHIGTTDCYWIVDYPASHWRCQVRSCPLPCSKSGTPLALSKRWIAGVWSQLRMITAGSCGRWAAH